MTPRTVLIATSNAGKLRDFAGAAATLGITIAAIPHFASLPLVVEDGATFEENAYKKAGFTAKVLGLPALADDSGLEVQALAGAPGVHSARYEGLGATDQENNAKLLRAMSGEHNRKARFCCVLSLAVPSGAALTYEGFCGGVILDSARGENGFGYDPLFLYPPTGRTFAEMSMEEKLSVSHRGRALNGLKDEFEKVLRWLELRRQEEDLRRGALEMCRDK
jgi:XTP/dITP diphosphohydrolase